MPKNDFLTGGYSCDNCNKPVGNTNIHNGGVFVKEQFCSNKCKDEWNARHSGSSSNKSNSDNEDSSSRGSAIGTAAGIGAGIGAGVGGAVAGGLNGLGNLAGKGFSAINAELDKGVNENKQKRAGIEAKAAEISKLEFGSTKEEIQNQLEQLITFGSTLKSEQHPIKKAVYSKVIFGIMRLKTLGANDVAVFLENEAMKVKPKWYNAVGFWMSFSNT